MFIAKKDFFTKEHIENHRHHTSPVLTEQVIHCMELVALLSHEGLNFMFKGGNSLLLLLSEPKRFSIDVDIATDENKERIEQILDSMVNKSDVFTRWEKRVHKTKPWLPMSSYYIFYDSVTLPSETNIMLDVQLKMSGYKKIRQQVRCGSFYYSDEIVLLPSISSLIGDKLLTLGPETLGIPVNKGKEAQRLKHSFDISLLSSKPMEIEEIRESIRICMEQENSLQKTSFSLAEIFEDTIRYCGSVVKYDEEPPMEGLVPYLSEIVTGRKPFEAHIFAKDYSWQDLQIDLAKSAVCLTAVFCDKVSSEELNDVMTTPKDLGFYWNKITEWIGRNPL
jgi:hypothetical protein